MTTSFPHLKKMPESESEWFQALINLARFLRGPEGCPWDRKQTSKDFAHFLHGEAEELNEALQGSDNAHIEEEFGDTFFCLMTTAAAAEAEGLFTLQGALERAHEKMIRRHDHVFSGNTAATPEQAIEAWEQVKAREKKKDNT